MSLTQLEAAKDLSTYVVTAAFTDEDGVAVVPTTLTWTLTDGRGNTVNTRSDVAVAVPAASVDFVLSGNDLAYSVGQSRELVVEGTYTSDAGADLPLRDACQFVVLDLVGV